MTNSTHKALFPYQADGVQKLLGFLRNSSGRAALLADEPGLGKTAQAISVMRGLGARKVLILCPASLRLNWEREIRAWTADIATLITLILGGSDVRSSCTYAEDAPIRITIVSYALASRNPVLGMLAGEDWDLLILDEAHAVKSVTSQVARSCLVLLWARARYRLALTGTPIPNGRASEAWSLFSRLCPEQFGQWKPFASKYCIPEETPWGLTYPRSKNLVELGRIAHEKFMVRRSRDLVLKDLPPLIRSIVPLEVPGLLAKDAEEGLSIGEIMAAIEGGVPLRSDHLSTARRKLGVLKAEPAAEYLMDLLEEIENVVVFCHHKEVFLKVRERLETAGIKSVVITGQTGVEERQRAVDAFQAGEARVFIGSLSAANTGITLTRASVVVFVEADWVPSTNEQAEGRIRRIGQIASMRAIYLVADGSLDEAIMRSVLRKQKDIERVMGAA